jgi:flagellar biosynthesis protein FliQ
MTGNFVPGTGLLFKKLHAVIKQINENRQIFYPGLILSVLAVTAILGLWTLLIVVGFVGVLFGLIGFFYNLIHEATRKK